MESILVREYGLDSTGLGQYQTVGFYVQYNVHFHENKPHSSDVLFTITEKAQSLIDSEQTKILKMYQMESWQKKSTFSFMTKHLTSVHILDISWWYLLLIRFICVLPRIYMIVNHTTRNMQKVLHSCGITPVISLLKQKQYQVSH